MVDIIGYPPRVVVRYATVADGDLHELFAVEQGEEPWCSIADQARRLLRGMTPETAALFLHQGAASRFDDIDIERASDSDGLSPVFVVFVVDDITAELADLAASIEVDGWVVNVETGVVRHQDNGWTFQFPPGRPQANYVDGLCIEHPPVAAETLVEAAGRAREAGEAYVRALQGYVDDPGLM